MLQRLHSYCKGYTHILKWLFTLPKFDKYIMFDNVPKSHRPKCNSELIRLKEGLIIAQKKRNVDPNLIALIQNQYQRYQS